eukprot:scaffold4321_cov33-Tisochrysis_lutea.AAC.1
MDTWGQRASLSAFGTTWRACASYLSARGVGRRGRDAPSCCGMSSLICASTEPTPYCESLATELAQSAQANVRKGALHALSGTAIGLRQDVGPMLPQVVLAQGRVRDAWSSVVRASVRGKSRKDPAPSYSPPHAC